MQILVYLAIWAVIWGFRLLPTVVRFFFRIFCEYAIAPFITPSGHAKYGDYEETEGYDSLSRESYTIESRWASDSVAKIK